ncbi:hypothetical protein AOQ72_06415 [Bradyrhizobium yuanmingense]|uniref:Uncharacterized protein n=1 Tax=Bradyrhizobium yuanmingense TaxID=108015 RepID=A0A0R3CYS5_9BRAD|nr:hypothetical protein AOQ72_06415 [Bradyrhizobium yuanmingense]
MLLRDRGEPLQDEQARTIRPRLVDLRGHREQAIEPSLLIQEGRAFRTCRKSPRGLARCRGPTLDIASPCLGQSSELIRRHA